MNEMYAVVLRLPFLFSVFFLKVIFALWLSCLEA